MKHNAFYFILAISLAIASPLTASPQRAHSRRAHQKHKVDASLAITQSAHGWAWSSGEWTHPDGYRFVNGRVLRTTAKAGSIAPKPPGKLALENPGKLAAKPAAPNVKTQAQQAAESKSKSWSSRPPSQTGTNL